MLTGIAFLVIACACCGLRCWLVPVLLGAGTHLEWYVRHPAWAESFSIFGLPAAMAMFFSIHLVEFGLDKTPRLDTWSDRMHFIFRPLIGAGTAFLLVLPHGLFAAIAAAAIGGILAWFVHARKARLRRYLNQGKPLLRTVGASLAEDILVGLLLWFSFMLLA